MDFNIKNGESYVPVDVDVISVSDVDMSTVQLLVSKKEIGLYKCHIIYYYTICIYIPHVYYVYTTRIDMIYIYKFKIF